MTGFLTEDKLTNSFCEKKTLDSDSPVCLNAVQKISLKHKRQNELLHELLFNTFKVEQSHSSKVQQET